MVPQTQLPRTEEVPSSYREQFLALHGVPVYFFDEVEKVSRDAKRQPRIAVVTREQLFLADKAGDIKKCVQVRELTAIWHCAPRSADLVLRCADEAAQDTWLVCRTVAAAERLARVAVALAQPLPIAVEAHAAVDKHLLNLEKPAGYTIQINPIDIPQPRCHLVSSSSAVAASAARLGQQQQQFGMDTAEAVAAASSSGAAAAPPGGEPSSFEGQSPTSSVPPKLNKRGSLANHEQFFSTPDDAAASEAEPVKILAAPPSANKGSDSDATAPQGPDSPRSRASPRASQQQKRRPPPPPPPQSLPPATGETRENRRSTAAPDAALPHYSTFTSAGRSAASAAASKTAAPKAQQPPAPLRPSTSTSAAAAATAAPLPRSPLTPAAATAASATTTRFPTSASPMMFPQSARAQQPSSAVAPAQGWASSGGGSSRAPPPQRGPSSSSSSVFDWPRIGPVDSRNLFSVPVPTSAGRTRMLSVPEHATAAVQDLAVEMQDSIDDLRAHRGAHGSHSSSASPAWPPASQAQSLSRVGGGGGGGGDHGAVFPTDLIKAKRSTNREYLERDGREGGSSSILYALSTERR